MHILLDLCVEMDAGQVFKLLWIAEGAIIEVFVCVSVDAVHVEKSECIEIMFHAVPNENRLTTHFAQVFANLRNGRRVAQPILVDAMDHDKVAIDLFFRVDERVENHTSLIVYD